MQVINFRLICWTVLGLSALAIALPLFNTLSTGATFFVAHGAGRSELLLFTFVIYFSIPALLICLVYFMRAIFGSFVEKFFLALSITVLSGLCLIPFTLAWPAALAIVSCLGLGGLVAWAFYFSKTARALLQMIGQVSLVVPVFFLFFTPVKDLLSSEDALLVEGIAGKEIPITMLVFDELPLAVLLQPDGSIDSERLPNFARLAEMSTWYAEATTVSVNTHWSIPSMLSGKYSTKGALPILSAHPQNLFTLVAASHKVHAIEFVSQLCPPSVCHDADRQVSRTYSARSMYSDTGIVWLHAVVPVQIAKEHLPSIDSKWHGFGAGDSGGQNQARKNLYQAVGQVFQSYHKSRIKSFLSNVAEGSGAVLNYLHIGLPHQPWIYLPNGTVYNGRSIPGYITGLRKWSNDEQQVDQAMLRFTLQVEYVDYILGKALDVLESSGRLNETMLIVVSDHGLAIAPGKSKRKPEDQTIADLARIPLFIKYPAQVSGKRDDRKVETIDIFPTIAEVLDVAPGQDVDGQSLLFDAWKPGARRVLEVGFSGDDLEAKMDLSRAIGRYARVLTPGQTSLASWATTPGGLTFMDNYAPEAIQPNQYLKLHLDRPEWYTNVNPDSGFLPARLVGTVEGAAKGSEILITLNGKFSGGGTTYDDEGSLSIMLNPKHFRLGLNELAAYELHKDKLTRVEIASKVALDWSIERDENGIKTAQSGSGIMYRRGEESPGVAFISRHPALASIAGAVHDEKLQRTPDILLLIDDTTVITDNFRFFPGRSTKNYMAAAIYSKFSLELTADQMPRDFNLSVLALWREGYFREIQLVDAPDSVER
jgi:hypothetical protein